MNEKILCVDDDSRVLSAYERRLGEQFVLETAGGGDEALQRIRDSGPYAVVVSDRCMPGMDGIQLLARVQELAPETVRIMLTGQADLATTIEAVNQGRIFRFLCKPCPAELLAKALGDGLEQYRLVRMEKELLENTLKGSLKVLAEVLSLVNPVAFGRSSRIQRLVAGIAEHLQVPDRWQVDVAAMLSHIGCVTVPDETLARAQQGLPLSVEEHRIIEQHPQVGKRLLAEIPRLEPVAEIVGYQQKQFDGGGFPADPLRGDQLPLGSRILKVALDFDALESGGVPPIEAVHRLRERAGRYDPAVLNALEKILANLFQLDKREVEVRKLVPGMVLASDIRADDGRLLLAKGNEVTQSLLERLRNFRRNGVVMKPVWVLDGGRRPASAAPNVPERQVAPAR